MRTTASIAAFAAILSAATFSLGHAASFDCQKAEAEDEKAICSSPALNDTDIRMATMFDLATEMVAMGERDTLKSAQAKWLEKRKACGKDQACLEQAYKQRLDELHKIFTDFASKGKQ